MKVVLLENLLISGNRYTVGEEIDVDETVGFQLLKENLALTGVNEVESEASLPTPEAAFAPIPEAQDEPEMEVKRPVKRRATKRVTV